MGRGSTVLATQVVAYQCAFAAAAVTSATGFTTGATGAASGQQQSVILGTSQALPSGLQG